MKLTASSSILTVAILSCFILWIQPLSSQQSAPSGEAQYHVVHGWPILPDGQALGQATGVGVDSHDNVFVFHRAGRRWSDPFPPDPIKYATIACFDGKTGRQIASWGEDIFIMPHGLTIDNEDNLWLTDVGRHQVFKFDQDGQLLLTLGEQKVPGSDEKHFNLPTDVAVLQDGSFYVSDGYGNTRVVRFSAQGEFLFEWGTPGSAPGEFGLPHGIAVDENERVFVADRSNSRIQIFDSTGIFLAEWKSQELGRPYSMAIGTDNSVYVVDGGDQIFPFRSKAIKLTAQGDVLTQFGRWGNYDGQFLLAHDIALDSKEAIYVVDAWGQRVQKFVQKR